MGCGICGQSVIWIADLLLLLLTLLSSHCSYIFGELARCVSFWKFHPSRGH